MYGFLRARLIEPADAEDLCQEVFLRCYLGREKLSRASDGRRLAGRDRPQYPPRARPPAASPPRSGLDRIMLGAGRAGRWSTAAANDDALAHLPACLSSLGQSAREAIDLRYRAQLRMAAIAERLKRSEGAVKLLVHRAARGPEALPRPEAEKADMTDAELIALLEQKTPEELTLEEIELLRRRLAESDELRQTLLGQLQMETYLTEALSRIDLSPDKIVARASQQQPSSSGSTLLDRAADRPAAGGAGHGRAGETLRRGRRADRHAARSRRRKTRRLRRRQDIAKTPTVSPPAVKPVENSRITARCGHRQDSASLRRRAAATAVASGARRTGRAASLHAGRVSAVRAELRHARQGRSRRRGWTACPGLNLRLGRVDTQYGRMRQLSRASAG